MKKCFFIPAFLLLCSSIFTYANEQTDEKLLTSLANKYGSDKGSYNAKYHAGSHHYTRHYAKLFHEIRNKPLEMVEIGLNLSNFSNYASLNIWLDYFPNANIYGIDINIFPFPNDRVILFQGDQGSDPFWQKFINDVPVSFDIVIDDGSHYSPHQQKTLGYLFPKLKSGGLYIIEDLHYTPQKEDKHCMVAFLKTLITKDLNSLQKLNRVPTDQLSYLIDQVESIEFFDSATFGPEAFAVIRKKKA